MAQVLPIRFQEHLQVSRINAHRFIGFADSISFISFEDTISAGKCEGSLQTHFFCYVRGVAGRQTRCAI